jgi:hypothetical protein
MLTLMARMGVGWQLGTLAVLVSLWLGLSALLVGTWGKPETFLVKTLGRFSRDDAFEHLNGVSVVFWSVHSLLVLIAIAATKYRRTDVLTVLMIGPVIAAAIVLLGQSWADPNWFEVVAICSSGWLAGSVVGSAYWIVKPRGVRPDPPLQEVRPTT